MTPASRPSHPIVKAAALVLVAGAAALGVWAGSSDGPPSPRAPDKESAPEPTFLPAGDTLPANLDAEHGASVFELRCARCHTIGGGDRQGPDLARAALRRDRLWVEAMITAPDSMFATDSLAQWVLSVHDIGPEDATRDNPDLQALSAYFASFAPRR
jgi:mono/diheme cytochrome c family protein